MIWSGWPARFKTEEEAVAIANDTSSGLAGDFEFNLRSLYQCIHKRLSPAWAQFQL